MTPLAGGWWLAGRSGQNRGPHMPRSLLPLGKSGQVSCWGSRDRSYCSTCPTHAGRCCHGVAPTLALVRLALGVHEGRAPDTALGSGPLAEPATGLGSLGSPPNRTRVAGSDRTGYGARRDRESKASSTEDVSGSLTVVLTRLATTMRSVSNGAHGREQPRLGTSSAVDDAYGHAHCRPPWF